MDENVVEILKHVSRIHRGVVGILSRALPRKEITPTYMHALSILADEGPLPIGRLASKMRLSRPATTNLANRLENKGWARRSRPADRRVVLVGVTPEGRRIIGILRETMRDVIEGALEGLSRRDREAILRFYRAFDSKVSEG